MDSVIGKNIQYEEIRDGGREYNYDKEEQIRQRILKLKKYYEDKDITMIGLNDSQGIDTNLLFRKGVLEYLRDMLKTEKQKVTTINVFSMMFNKTEHVDYFLDANLSLEEIKELQVQGMVSAMSKFFHNDLSIPKIFGNLGNVGYVSRMLYRKNKEDRDIHLKDNLANAKEPIVIYSSGANDLMREAYCNPFSIVKAYKERDVIPTYDYAVWKLKDPNTFKEIMSRIQKNFEHILDINPEADIFTLGLYFPVAFNQEGMEIFNEAIQKYNDQLYSLCKKYEVSYISTENSNYLQEQKNNFHASYGIQKELAYQVIDALYLRKEFTSRFEYISRLSKQSLMPEMKEGLLAVNEALKKDYERAQNEETEAFKKMGRQEENEKLLLYREYCISMLKQEEIERQMTAVKKAYLKTKKRK